MDKVEFTIAICNELTDPPDIKKALADWWWPTNSFNDGHLRLRLAGKEVLSTLMQPHEFEFLFYNTLKQIKLLGNLRVPYYVQYNSITFFSPGVALMIRLYGSVDRYLELIQND